jgi:hypothetical protein
MFWGQQCKVPREAVKSLTIWKMPRTLIVHLKRFYFEGPFRSKLNTKVSFPLEGLVIPDPSNGVGNKKSYVLALRVARAVSCTCCVLHLLCLAPAVSCTCCVLHLLCLAPAVSCHLLFPVFCHMLFPGECGSVYTPHAGGVGGGATACRLLVRARRAQLQCSAAIACGLSVSLSLCGVQSLRPFSQRS